MACLTAAALAAQGTDLRGFLAKNSAEEQRLEQQARSVPDSERLVEYSNFIAGEPHNAGSPRSKAVAEYIAQKLRDFGLDTEIEEFEALMPYPTVRQVQVIAPEPYTATLKEPAMAADPSSGQPNQLPTYNAYGATGDVTGDAVYANYGLPEDYEWLARAGISVKGKVVITRYGKSWRGLKPKLAAEHGAIACLIYSDPRDDGYFDGETYPKGPMRPPVGVQRGSVMDMTLYPGDPLSPGTASVKGAKRLSIGEAKTLMKIPVLPISYADATPILRQLTGPVVPVDWRGALPFTYHAGPGAARVHVKTDYDWTSKPLFDVVATIPGAEMPDEWVIAGNHHDAWVNGADDPTSGAVALLETARSLGSLMKQGWKPKRTIKIAFWDGEEFGLLGSTEWVEKHQDELKEKAVAYINSDNTARGWLNISGSHTLEEFATEVASSIQQPGSSQNLADYALHHPPVEPGAEPAQPKSDKGFSIGALGAGSDYQGFLDYVGVASLNDDFSGNTKSGIYHSIYDSLHWYSQFSDGNRADGKALSQFTTTALLRLANSSILPFEFEHFATTVGGYVDEIQKESEKNGHKLEFSGLRKQLETLKETGRKYDALLEATALKDSADPARLAALNQLLMRTERVLTRPEGLPGRPWYKHQIYAPGLYTGYAVKTVPGVREAVEMKNWTAAQHEAAVVEECLAEMNQVINQAADELAGM